MEPVTIKLQKPVHHGSETISELVVQRPKAKHLRMLPAQPKTGDVLDLAAKLCGQPPSVIDELEMEDTSALLEVVGNFMEPGQKIGNKG